MVAFFGERMKQNVGPREAILCKRSVTFFFVSQPSQKNGESLMVKLDKLFIF
jgi:hypothetical protein